MKPLLDDRWAPVTSEMGFVECAAPELAAWYSRWLDDLPGNRSQPATLRRVDAGLEGNLMQLLPLTSPIRRRYLFQATGSRWSAYFDNGARNSDAANLSLVARKLGCRALRVVAMSEGRDATKRRRATAFELYGPSPTEFLNYVRSVAVMYDSKWRFVAAGTPQPFEQLERYDARRIEDRFDAELLEKYMAELGIRCFDDAFYLSEGYLVENFRTITAKERELSLSEARREAGVE